MKRLALYLAAIGLSACMPMPPMAPESPRLTPVAATFTLEAHQPYLEAGTNTVQGQAFLRQQGGGVVTCAGSEVLLLPATAYFREVFTDVRRGLRPIINDPGTIHDHVTRRTVCDVAGHFEVNHLPDGGWFVMTAVTWIVGGARQGGVLAQEFRVDHEETAHLVLADKDFIGHDAGVLGLLTLF
jgi:hypothetical protein